MTNFSVLYYFFIKLFSAKTGNSIYIYIKECWKFIEHIYYIFLLMFCIFFNIWILVNCYHLTNRHKIIFKIYNTYIFTISLTSFIIVSYEYILTNYMHYYFYSLSLFLYIYISFYVIRKRLSNKIFRILSWSTVPYKRSLEKLFSKLTPAYLSFHSFQQTFIHTPSILLFSPFLSLLCIIHAINFYQILHFPLLLLLLLISINNILSNILSIRAD